MLSKLDLVEHIVVVIMENRSFDHMLGYLSLPEYGRTLDGVSFDPGWIAGTTNLHNGVQYPPFRMSNGSLIGDALGDDPPHERDDMEKAIRPFPDLAGPPTMNGFVSNYAQVQSLDPGSYCEVVGFYTKDEVPITHFLAENFAVCDRWFACLPASTWPNRLMAMAGFTYTENTVGNTIPDQWLVYDWLSDRTRDVSWRVYHEGWPIFTLMPRMRMEILRDAVMQNRFRWFDNFAKDYGSAAPFPQVVFIEPKYTPDHYSTAMNSDDHPNSSIAGGQRFLRRIYSALIRNPERWQRTVMIVTYDENGGFFDHVPPLPIRTDPPQGANYSRPFLTSGLRVPGLIVSPLVEAGMVFSEPLDHTCILKFLGWRFDRSGKFLPQVDSRCDVDGKPLSDIRRVLTRSGARTDRPTPPSYDPVVRGGSAPRILATPFSDAFDRAAKEMRDSHSEVASIKFPHARDFFQNR